MPKCDKELKLLKEAFKQAMALAKATRTSSTLQIVKYNDTNLLSFSDRMHLIDNELNGR